ncbi:major capsid protein [Adonisia turfae]
MRAFAFPYDAVELTDEVNLLPNVWDPLQGMGLFPFDGVTTTRVEIAFKEGQVYVLSAEERGAQGTVETENPEDSVVIKVPHFPHLATIKPEDLQDRFVFGSRRRETSSLAEATARKLTDVRQHHAQTMAWLRMCALKGQLFDGRGRLIYDFFSVFQVQKKVVYFDLANDATDVIAKCDEVRQHMEDNLLGETMDGVRALVGKDFMSKFVNHPTVKEKYLNWNQAAALASAREREDFPFGGVIFRQESRVVSGVDKQARRFVELEKGHAWPTGTMQAHKTYGAPPHHVDYANTEGVEVFISPEILKHGKGVELHTESNPLPVWKRPALLVELSAAAAP